MRKGSYPLAFTISGSSITTTAAAASTSTSTNSRSSLKVNINTEKKSQVSKENWYFQLKRKLAKCLIPSV